MKTAISLMLALVTTTALTSPGRLVPARLSRIGLVLHAVVGRAGRHRQAAERHMPVGLAREQQLLPA
jgi:hypothetical protein